MKSFDGTWVDQEGTEVIIKRCELLGPDWGRVVLNYVNETTCAFGITGHVYIHLQT